MKICPCQSVFFSLGSNIFVPLYVHGGRRPFLALVTFFIPLRPCHSLSIFEALGAFTIFMPFETFFPCIGGMV